MPPRFNADRGVGSLGKIDLSLIRISADGFEWAFLVGRQMTRRDGGLTLTIGVDTSKL
jgi:hypothetical protein